MSLLGSFLSHPFQLRKSILGPLSTLCLCTVSLSTFQKIAWAHGTPQGELQAHSGMGSEAGSAGALQGGLADFNNSIIKRARQLTFLGPRSGEGYFSADGKQMIFQSEREPGNPFYQMYRMDLVTGQTTRLSPGNGKTTCGWFHPNGKQVLFSSTHHDPEALKKQKEELEIRKKPVKAKYSWSFDEEFDIFTSDLDGKKIRPLTQTKGYDAEASFSPDGKWVAFASNRLAYSDSNKLKEEDQKIFAKDASYLMDIYIMKSDGSEVRQLTAELGYDGGPFFSPDSQRIVWRHFNSMGTLAEIWTMKIDGTDKKQITTMGVMSWAPFYHPSGDYLIFASSALGMHNFELFIVDSEGRHAPVRVTSLDGFDGLSSFSPDGRTVTWAHRNEKGDSQIYLADWDDGQARRVLDLPPRIPQLGVNLIKTSDHIESQNLQIWLDYLASGQFGGRPSGGEEEKIYSREIANYFKNLGLRGGAEDGGFLDHFEFTSAIELGPDNTLEIVGSQKESLKVGEDYQPLSMSGLGEFKEAPIVFVGYGIKAQGTDKEAPYNSYQGLDVKGKWVIVLKDIPLNISKERRSFLQYFSHHQHKVRVAKNEGAQGVIFVDPEGLRNGESEGGSVKLGKLQLDGARSDLDLGVFALKPAWLMAFLKKADQNLTDTLNRLDRGEFVSGIGIPSLYLRAKIDLQFKKSRGTSVVAILPAKGGLLNSQKAPKSLDRPPGKSKIPQTIIIGAHGDHLGRGELGSSLARGPEKGLAHVGADDNASGVSGVLELARVWSRRYQRFPQRARRSIVFAVWSGEEIGVLGSTHFAKSGQLKTLGVEAYLNLDMIGRLRDKLFVQGGASADYWPGLMERLTLKHPDIPLQLLDDPYVPTDSMAFYLAEIPTLGFFTGAHEDYHSPRDVVEKINLRGEVQVLDLMDSVLSDLAFAPQANHRSPIKYQKVEGQSQRVAGGRGFRIYLGTIPDYSSEGIQGVKISGTTKGSPAEKAGLLAGDLIVELDGKKIENIYDYVFSLQTMKAGESTLIKIIRNNKNEELKITPQLKE